MKKSFEGGCLCGDVRYVITTALVAAAICHCVSCRRAAGAESVAWMACPAVDIEFTRAVPAIYNSSDSVARTFCQRCGTSLTYQVKEDILDVALATLDDPEQITPTKEIWVESRLSWNSLHGELPVHTRG